MTTFIKTAALIAMLLVPDTSNKQRSATVQTTQDTLQRDFKYVSSTADSLIYVLSK